MASVRSLGVFPFCPEAYNATADELFYIAVDSLQEAMDAYWRVKTWQFAVTGGTLDSYTTDFTGTERNLVCSGILHQASGTITSLYPIEDNWEIDAGPFEDSKFVKTDGSQLYLRIFGGFGAFTLFGEDGSNTSKGRTAYLEFTFSAPDLDFEVVVTPDEWHEYDPGDGGGPIYDSETGDQLRGFPL